MFEPDDALETQPRCPSGESPNRDAVAEDVVHPPDVGRFWRDHQLRLKQLLVVAVPRPQHHAVLAEEDRLLVAVGRDVPNSKDWHCLPICGLAACSWGRSEMSPKKAIESSRVIAIS